MSSGTIRNDFTERLASLRQECADIREDRAAIDRREQRLFERMARLVEEAAEAPRRHPHTVKASYIIRELSWSEKQFRRIRDNPAKGFPAPVWNDSDPRWIWDEVADWSRRTRGA